MFDFLKFYMTYVLLHVPIHVSILHVSIAFIPSVRKFLPRSHGMRYNRNQLYLVNALYFFTFGYIAFIIQLIFPKNKINTSWYVL